MTPPAPHDSFSDFYKDVQPRIASIFREPRQLTPADEKRITAMEQCIGLPDDTPVWIHIEPRNGEIAFKPARVPLSRAFLFVNMLRDQMPPVRYWFEKAN